MNEIFDTSNDNFDKSKIQFIEVMEDLVAYAYEHSAKFPKRFGNNFTNRILINLSLAQECVIHANEIKLDYKYWKYGKSDATYELYKKVYDNRTSYLNSAIEYLKTVSRLLKTGKKMNITELIEHDDDCLKKWLGLIVKEVKLLNGLIRSDAKAFKRFSITFGKEFSAYIPT